MTGPTARESIDSILYLVGRLQTYASGTTDQQYAFDLMVDVEELRRIDKHLGELLDAISDELEGVQ